MEANSFSLLYLLKTVSIAQLCGGMQSLPLLSRARGDFCACDYGYVCDCGCRVLHTELSQHSKKNPCLDETDGFFQKSNDHPSFSCSFTFGFGLYFSQNR